MNPFSKSLLIILSFFGFSFSSNSLAQWITTEWLFVCEVSCDNEAELAGQQLEQASLWLQNLGFPEPKLSVNSRRFLGSISDTETTRQNARGETERDWGNYDPESKKIYLSTEFDNGDAEDQATPVHELFHAIQNAYPNEALNDTSRKWIQEGSADAVLAAWLYHNAPEEGLKMGFQRFFDLPLHEPGDDAGAYGTHLF